MSSRDFASRCCQHLPGAICINLGDWCIGLYIDSPFFDQFLDNECDIFVWPKLSCSFSQSGTRCIWLYSMFSESFGFTRFNELDLRRYVSITVLLSDQSVMWVNVCPSVHETTQKDMPVLIQWLFHVCGEKLTLVAS